MLILRQMLMSHSAVDEYVGTASTADPFGEHPVAKMRPSENRSARPLPQCSSAPPLKSLTRTLCLREPAESFSTTPESLGIWVVFGYRLRLRAKHDWLRSVGFPDSEIVPLASASVGLLGVSPRIDLLACAAPVTNAPIYGQYDITQAALCPTPCGGHSTIWLSGTRT